MTALNESELAIAETCSYQSPFLKWLYSEAEKRGLNQKKTEPKEEWLKGMGIEGPAK